MFDRLIWEQQRVIVNGIPMRLEQAKVGDGDQAPADFDFFKGLWTVEQYGRFLTAHPELRVDNLLELGIWDGGSMVFWFEHFQPRRHVALDISPRGDSEPFRRYVAERGLERRLTAAWGVDQADGPRLREIIAREFEGPLDLVLDDASHWYDPSKASFETLFPLLRPGGWYIIEDWAWAHWPQFQSERHAFGGGRPLTPLVAELVAAVASTQVYAPRAIVQSTETVRHTWIAEVVIYPHFVAVERGDKDAAGAPPFHLADIISALPAPAAPLARVSLPRRAIRWLRRVAG